MLVVIGATIDSSSAGEDCMIGEDDDGVTSDDDGAAVEDSAADDEDGITERKCDVTINHMITLTICHVNNEFLTLIAIRGLEITTIHNKVVILTTLIINNKRRRDRVNE